MPRLKNLKHEEFSKQLIKEKGNQTKAYQNTYKTSTITSRVNASKLLTNSNVAGRVQELLDKREATSLDGLLEGLARKTHATKPLVFKDQIQEVEDNSTQLDAIKTGLKMHGALDKGGGGNTYNTLNTQVNMGQLESKKLNNVVNQLETLSKSLNLVQNYPVGEVKPDLEGGQFAEVVDT